MAIPAAIGIIVGVVIGVIATGVIVAVIIVLWRKGKLPISEKIYDTPCNIYIAFVCLFSTWEIYLNEIAI